MSAATAHTSGNSTRQVSGPRTPTALTVLFGESILGLSLRSPGRRLELDGA
jgi:hypothetical protein